MPPAALLVIAKEPLPGRAKTRLTPPCSADQARELAGAALLDTLDVVAANPGLAACAGVRRRSARLAAAGIRSRRPAR